MAAVDCVRTALILTLSNPGTGTGPNSGPNSAVDFAVDGVVHRVPAGEDRSVALAVAEDAAYRVLVTSPAGSQTFSGVLSCSPPDSRPSPTAPPGAAGEPNAGQPSGANVPGEPAGGGISATGAGAVLGDPDPTSSGGTEGEQALAAAGGPIAGGEASVGTAAERGRASDRGGQLAATGAPDLATVSMAASGLLALGAGLVLVGRSRPRKR
jgi:hypothetical protein